MNIFTFTLDVIIIIMYDKKCRVLFGENKNLFIMM